jgi:CheY-like chemotaxis protein
MDMALTALIVDDHAGFRAAARLLLESEGFAVVGEAADGGSAVAAGLRLRPDLVMLDVQLPDITGFAVAHSLRDAGFTGRVVLVSSRAASEYGELVGDSGATGFIANDELSETSFACRSGSPPRPSETRTRRCWSASASTSARPCPSRTATAVPMGQGTGRSGSASRRASRVSTSVTTR